MMVSMAEQRRFLHNIKNVKLEKLQSILSALNELQELTESDKIFKIAVKVEIDYRTQSDISGR